MGHAVAQSVDALSYKSEGRGFDYSWGVKAAGASGRVNLTAFMCRLSWYLKASNSWNPQGLSRHVQRLLYLYLQTISRDVQFVHSQTIHTRTARH